MLCTFNLLFRTRGALVLTFHPQPQKDQSDWYVGMRWAHSFHGLTTLSLAVVAADGLSKRDVFRLPDPFAVITVDAEQTHTTSVIKKTLNPYWNESFDMLVLGADFNA
jgi:hypothetical protein